MRNDLHHPLPKNPSLQNSPSQKNFDESSDQLDKNRREQRNIFFRQSAIFFLKYFLVKPPLNFEQKKPFASIEGLRRISATLQRFEDFF